MITETRRAKNRDKNRDEFDVAVGVHQSSVLSLLCGSLIYEPRPEKTGFLHMRKQRRRSASR